MARTRIDECPCCHTKVEVAICDVCEKDLPVNEIRVSVVVKAPAMVCSIGCVAEYLGVSMRE